mgnify:FL=1
MDNKYKNLDVFYKYKIAKKLEKRYDSSKYIAGHAAAPALRTDLWQSCRIRYIKGEVFSDY